MGAGKPEDLLPHGLEHKGERSHLEKQIRLCRRPGDWLRGGENSNQSRHHALLHSEGVARPQTHPPTTFTDKRQKLAEVRRPQGIRSCQPSSVDPHGPSREQGGQGGSRNSRDQRWPTLLHPLPHPGRTRSTAPTRSKRPKMHQPITSSAAAAAIFASGPDKPKGEGREGTGLRGTRNCAA